MEDGDGDDGDDGDDDFLHLFRYMPIINKIYQSTAPQYLFVPPNAARFASLARYLYHQPADDCSSKCACLPSLREFLIPSTNLLPSF